MDPLKRKIRNKHVAFVRMTLTKSLRLFIEQNRNYTRLVKQENITQSLAYRTIASLFMFRENLRLLRLSDGELLKLYFKNKCKERTATQKVFYR